MDRPLSVLSQISALLDQLNIRYVLVGSFASSFHGLYRSTADIDILADIKAPQVRSILEALEKSFYVDEKALREAVDQRRSFNAIHYDSVFKVDIFIARNDEFAEAQLQRRELREVPDTESDVYVATAEDTILAKLRWYRAGHEVSNTQWNDVLGILRINQRRLDSEYLNNWAEKLGVTDLLLKAFEEVK
jgi:hypothetical protein